MPPVFADVDTIQTYDGYLRALDEGRFDTLLAIPEADRLSEEQAWDLISRTWELSLKLLEQRGSRLARLLLGFLACFADAPVPYELLLQPGTLTALASFSGVTGPRVWQNLRDLSDFGFIEFNDQAQSSHAVPLVPTLHLHPLIRDISRHNIDAEQLTDAYVSLAAKSVDWAITNNVAVPEDPRRWPLWQALTPHAVHVLVTLGKRSAAGNEVLQQAAHAVSMCARYLSANGLHQRAADLYDTVLAVYQRVLPADHESTLTTWQDIAWEVAQQGDYARAEAMYRGVLETNTRVLGSYHISTLAARHEVARVQARRGNAVQAETTLREILEDETRLLGAEHPATLVTGHEIARIAAELGDYPRAEEAYRDVADAKARVLGADHPSTLASRHSVAWVVTQRGDLPRAEALYRSVVKARRRVLGANHPSTLASRHDIAWITARQGDYTGAEKLFREILRAKTHVLGADHPSTLVTRHSTAWVKAQQVKDYPLAKALYQEVLDAKARVFGFDRPDRIASQAQSDRHYLH